MAEHPGESRDGVAPCPVFAQMGPTAWRPRWIEGAAFVSPEECRRRMREASVIVGHAGMGTILGALELGKPLVIMPRRADLGEQRNDHQLATARRFGGVGRVVVAWDEGEVAARLDEVLAGLQGEAPVVRVAAAAGEGGAAGRHGGRASPRLIGFLREYIATGVAPARREAAAEERVGGQLREATAG